MNNDNDNVINVLVKSERGFLTELDIQNSIEAYKDTLIDPDELFNNKSFRFNGLLRYIHSHNIKSILPNTRRYNYELLDNIFCNIYIPLCYIYNHVPSVSNFICHLIQSDINNIYDIKTGTYRSYGSKVNPELQRFVLKWDSICDSDLVDYITHTNSIGGIFRAKTKGFQEQQSIKLEIDVQAPTLDTKQISTGLQSDLPMLPNDE